MSIAIQLRLTTVLVVSAGTLINRVSVAETKHVPSTTIPIHAPRSSTVPGGRSMREGIVAGSICLAKTSTQAEGQNLVVAGRFAEAGTKFQAALEVEKKSESPDPVTLACLMNMIGYSELQQRRAGFAAEWFRRALDLSSLPEPLKVRLMSNLAGAYMISGELDRAEETARQALVLATHAFGSDHEEALFPLTTLAGVHMLRGDLARAEPICRRVLFHLEKNSGVTSYEVSVAAGNLAMIYLLQHQYSHAGAHFEKALNGLRNSPSRAKGDIPLNESGLALSYAAGGRGREAKILLERALAAAEEELSPADTSLSVILKRGAHVRFLLKDYDSARQLFERAIALMETRYGPGSQPVLDGLQRYAEMLRAAKDKTRARQVDERRQALARKR